MPAIVHTYTSGSSATETVPGGGPYSCLVEAWGGGGAGAAVGSGSAGGGGGGGYSASNVAVASGDTFTYTVAASQAGPASPADGSNGNASSANGTVSGGTITVNGSGGGGGSSAAAGSGGNAFSGQINIIGGAGTFAAPGKGGAGANGHIGGQTNGAPGFAPGGGGAANVTGGTGGTGAIGQVQFTYTSIFASVADSSQIVLVEDWLDIKRTNKYLEFQLFGKGQQASAKYQPFTLLGSRPPAWFFEDRFVSVYSVIEAYSQSAAEPGVGRQPYTAYYKPSNRLLEDEWAYAKSDHSLLHQFRWIRLGIIRGYTFEVPDLNDYPWLEWPVDRTDKGAALFPFRQVQSISPKYQPSLLYWQSRNWDQEAERDIDRNPRHAEDLLLFGHLTPFTPIRQAAFGPFVMLSMWRTDESVWMASTINVSADGADLINGGGVTVDSGLKGDTNTDVPVPTISVTLPL